MPIKGLMPPAPFLATMENAVMNFWVKVFV